MIIVAGHVCLDIIPRFLGPASLDPGSLVRVGAATLSTGGVSNVGVALHRLGVPVKLIHRVGDDLFGQTVRALLGPEMSSGIRTVRGETTSYSVVVAPPGVDRMFVHCPGANDTFGPSDVSDQQFAGGTHFHFGYPPIMRGLLLDGGAGCAAILAKAQAAGLSTSLDLCSIDPASEAGCIDWSAWLARVLPHVDCFTPSYDELATILHEPIDVSRDGARRLAERCLSMGAKAMLIKLGSRGILHFDGASETHHPCFDVDVVTANGAGDCTIAGFLAAGAIGVLKIEDRIRFACAVGACCCEAADATGGVRSIADTQLRLTRGWTTRPTTFDPESP